MSHFWHAVGELAGVVVSASLGGVDRRRLQGSAPSSTAAIERCCAQLGWGVDERSADGIVLYFKGPRGGMLKVAITCGEKLTSFSVCCPALPGRHLQPEIPAHLLMRNAEMAMTAWRMAISGESVVFALTACTLCEGMDAAALQYLCENMVREVAAFCEKLREIGVL